MLFFRILMICLVSRAAFGQTVTEPFFRSGNHYTYIYRGEVVSYHDAIPHTKTVFRFQCELHIEMQQNDEGRFQVSACQLKDEGENVHKRSEDFAAAVQRHTSFFKMGQSGTFIQFLTEHEEPVAITNFKRGALASLQVDPSETTAERLVSRKGSSYCVYNINRMDGERRLTSVECDETHSVNLVNLLRVDGTAVVTTNLRQTYDLLHVTPSTASFSLQQLTRRLKSTSLLFEARHHVETSMEDVKLAFRKMMDGLKLSSTPTKKAIEMFQKFARVLRKIDQATMMSFLQTSWHCAHCTGTQKSIRQSRLIDGLVTCGTMPCIETYLQAAIDGYISGTRVQLFLIDVMLKKMTSLSIIQGVFRLCKKDNSRACWLVLGSMLHSYSESWDYSDSNQVYQVPSDIKAILTYLHQIIGTNCQPFMDNKTNRIIKPRDIILTLKTIGNVGQLIQLVDRELPQGQKIVPALLRCARNNHLSRDVRIQAIQALRRMQPDDTINSHLLDLLRGHIDPRIKIHAYRILMKKPTKLTLNAIIEHARKEMSENVRSYMVSHLKSILKSEDPSVESQKVMIWGVLAEQRQPLPRLPEASKSLSFHKLFYKTFHLPKIDRPIGVKVAVDVIYDPAASIPETVNLNLTVDAFGKAVNLLDCSLSTQYMDVVIPQLLGRHAESILKFLGIVLPRRSEKKSGRATFQHLRKSTADKLQQLDDNVKMEGRPDFALDLRILGHEIVFGSLKDVIPHLELLKNMRPTGVADLLDSLWRLGLNKNAYFDKASGFIDEEHTVQTVLGLPLTVTSSGHAILSFHHRLHLATNEGPDVMDKLLEIVINGGYFLQLSTKMAVSIPGFVETATAWSGEVNGTADIFLRANIKHEWSGSEVTFSNPFGNAKRDVFRVSTRRTVITDGVEQEVTSPYQEPIRDVCTPQSVYRTTGVMSCLGLRLPFSRERHELLSITPLVAGPFTLNLRLESTHRNSHYGARVELQHHPQRMNINGKPVWSEVRIIKLKVDGFHGSFPGEAGISRKTVSMEAEGELRAFRTNDDKPALMLDLGISYDGNVVFNIKYSKTMHEGPLEDPVPSTFIRFPATVAINISTPVAYLSMDGATIHHTPKDFFTQLNVTYFCADQTSFFYLLHVQPQTAFQRGHVTKWSNRITVKGGQKNDTGWSEVTYLMKYPGQKFEVLSNSNYNPVRSVTDAGVKWLSKFGTGQFLYMKSDITANRTKKGVDARHDVIGSMVDWDGYFSWSLFEEDTGYIDLVVGFNAFKNEKEMGHSLPERIDPAVYNISHLADEALKRLSRFRNNIDQMQDSLLVKVRRRGDAGVVRQRSAEREQFVSRFNQELNHVMNDSTMFEPTKTIVDDVFEGKLAAAKLRDLETFNTSNIWQQNPEGWVGRDNSNLPTDALNGSLIFWFRKATLQIQGRRNPVEYQWGSELVYPYAGGQQRLEKTGCYFDNKEIRTSQMLNINLSSSQLCANLVFDVGIHDKKKSFAIRHNVTMSHRGGSSVLKFYQYLNITKRSLKLEYTSFVNSTLLKGQMKAEANPISRGLLYDIRSDMVSPLRFLNFNLRDAGGIYIGLWRKSALTYHPYITTYRTLYLNNTYQLLTFDIIHLRGFDSPIMLTKEWTPRASHTTVKVPKYDVVFHYTVDKSQPTYRNMTFYHEFLSEGEHKLDASWQMALPHPHKLSSNLTITPTGKRGLSIIGKHISKVTFSLFKDVWQTMEHTFLPMEERRVDYPIEQLDRLHLEYFMRHRLSKQLEGMSSSCMLGPVYRRGTVVYESLKEAKNSLLRELHHAGVIDQVILVEEWLKSNLKSLLRGQQDVETRPIGPHLPDHQRNEQFYHNIWLPFKWENFDRLPKLSHQDKMLIRYIRDFFKTGRSAQTPFQPLYRTAMLFDPGYVRTFDGLLYEHPGYLTDECLYILARDFVGKTFAVLRLANSVMLLLPNVVISIDRDNRIEVDMAGEFVELPFVSQDGMVAVNTDGSSVTLDTAYGINVKCTRVNFLCLFSISEAYHNHTLGLFGNNDGNIYNELKKPTGQYAANITDFVDSYEVSGKVGCLSGNDDSSRDTDVPLGSCVGTPSPMCTGLFHNFSSPFSRCFRRIRPQSYMQSCIEATAKCVVANPQQTVCSLANSYATACRARGFHVQYTDFCVSCEGRHIGQKWQQTMRRTADIVLIISQHANMTSQPNISHRLQHLIHQMERELVWRQRYEDLRYSLVGFEGTESMGRPTSFTINGKLFGPYREFRSILRSIRYTGHRVTDALDAMHLAANYPFRPDAARVVILITSTERLSQQPRGPLRDVVNVLKANSIRLYTVSNYSDMTRRASVVGINWNNQLLTTSHKTSVVVSHFPRGDYAKLSKATKGAVFSLGHLFHHPTRFHETLSDTVHQQLADDMRVCRKCECSHGTAAGEGVTLCHHDSDGEC